MERLADWLKMLKMDSQVCAEAEGEGQTGKEREGDIQVQREKRDGG